MKTTAQIIRESLNFMGQVNEAQPSYKFKTTIFNPFPPTPEQQALEDSGQESGWEEEIEVGVDYTINGRYRPATRTDPEEYPDMDGITVIRLSDNVDITELVSDEVKETLGGEAWEHAENERDYNADQSKIDRYADSRSRWDDE